MSTLDIKKSLIRNITSFFGITIFCIIFSVVYNYYGHGVESLYMNYLFVWPLVATVWYVILIGIKLKPSRFSINMINAGILTFAGGSLLKGIMEIAGTSSPYNKYFFIVGACLVILGVAMFKRKAYNV